jgi:heptosyltransferase III
VSDPRFLILRGGAIGDFIVTLPAIEAIRRRWPESHIELVGYPHIARLALAGGLVDEVLSLDRAAVAEYFSFSPWVSPEQAAYVRSFDVVISYLHDPSGVVRKNLLEAGARQVIYCSPLVEAGYAADHLMKPLQELALYPEGPVYPRLSLKPEYRHAGLGDARAVGEKVVAIHPGSGSPKKNWPLRKFLALARRLKAETPLAPLFLLGEADQAIAEILPGAAPEFPVIGNRDLIDVASILSACQAYVGNDSGITQLAAALGIPAVCLYGPSDPAIWGPRGPNSRIVAARERTSESLALIEVEDVVRNLMEAVNASPGP